MESKKINIKGISYHYLELPNPGKPKILLIHGVIVESHFWKKIMELLKEDYHLYALDLKGHGLSDRGKSYIEDYTPEVIADDLRVFQEEVLKEPFYLVGYSLGGQYSISYAALHPEKVKSLIIIDSAPSLPLKGALTLFMADFTTPKFFKSLEDIRQFYIRKGNSEIADYMATYTMKQREDGKYELKFDKKNIAPKTFTENIRRNKYLWKRAKEITVPTLLIKAGKSKIINYWIVMLMKRVMPTLEVLEIPGEGHEFVFTAPEKVAEAVQSYLKK